MVQCYLESDISTYSGTGTTTTDGCTVSQVYEKITWGSCTQTEPDNTNNYHIEVRTGIVEFRSHNENTFI